MGEFFILAKFQGKGISNQVACQIWKMHPGLWEVSVIPENKRALAFWRSVISIFTAGHYTEVIKNVAHGEPSSTRYILSFHSSDNFQINDTTQV